MKNSELKTHLIDQLNNWRGDRDIAVFAREYQVGYYPIYSAMGGRRNLSAQLSRALLPAAINEHPPAAIALFNWVTGLGITNGDVRLLRPAIPNDIGAVRACLNNAYQQIGTVTDAAAALELAIPTAYYLAGELPSRPIQQPEPATGRKLCRGFYSLKIIEPIQTWLSFAGGVRFDGGVDDLGLL
jgi:hypothetical protein